MNCRLEPICLAFSLIVIWTFSSKAQQPTIKEYVVYGKESVQLGTSSNIIEGGKLGSTILIKSNGSATMNTTLVSTGRVELGNSNNINGNISVSNLSNLTGNIFEAGSNISLNGRLDVHGNAFIGGGTVAGPVITSGTYQGPLPASGPAIEYGNPLLIPLPTMPDPLVPVNYPIVQPALVTTSQISPGSYAGIALTGNKTITFRGPGDYIFSSITNAGNFNKFVFDFQNDPNKVFRIFVTGNVDLYKISVDYQNLPLASGQPTNIDLASRILMQVDGDGSTQGGNAWMITNGASGNNQSTWLGTVIAHNGSINIGSGSSLSKVIGSLWSGKSVNIQTGVSITYAALICDAPVANAGPDKTFICPETSTSIGSNLSSGLTYKWTKIENGTETVIGTDKIISVSQAGIYTLTVTNSCGETATDQVEVSYTSCVEPLNLTPGGKVENLIGAELTYLATNIEEAKKYLVILGLNDDSVLIEAVAKVGYEQAARDTMWKYGLRDTIPNGINPLLITGKFKIADLLTLLNPGPAIVINHIRPVFLPVGNAGIVTSAGDTSVGADLARNGFKINGDGVKIGVLSDSYNSLGSANIDITNGDLPGAGNPDGHIKPVQVVQDFPYGQRTDEGRAMLQIIHDLAPEAELAFRTGFVSAGDFAYGILQLKDAGCKVIVDDVTYVTEPFFRDGIVSKAVDIVNNENVAFFTSAGNFGMRSYTNSFIPLTVPGLSIPAHDFGGGDYRQRLRLKPGTYTIVLQWQDDVYSLGNTTAGTLNDLDFYLLDPSGTIGFNRNNIGGDPIEVLSFSINGTDPNMEVETELMILKAGAATGALNPTLKYIIFRGNAIIDEYHSSQPLVNKSTIVGHANSANAISVGAVLWSNTPAFGVNTPTIASFSSTGGTPVYVNGSSLLRAKPDITAPNGVNTSATVVMGPDNDGSGNADGFPNFFGTSAAAPHAAAIGALVLEARKKFYDEELTPSALKYFLFNTALPMQPDGLVGGVNFKAGYGLVQTDMAIRSFANPTPYINALHYDPTIIPGQVPFTLKISGTYLTSSTQIYFRGQPIQTTVNSSLDTISGDIPTFTGNPPINVYTPPFPGAIGDGGLSNTLYFFSSVKDTVTIIADNKVKIYGESLPALTTTILYNGDTLEVYNQKHNTNITPSDLGLSNINIRYTNPDMNPLTNVGTYQIRASRTFDTTNINDIGLLERYVYDSTFGNLQINKLAVTVQPNDTTIEYGEPLTNFTFNYIVDSTVTISNHDSLIAAIEFSHSQYMNDDALGLINSDGSGRIVIYNGKVLPVFNSPSVIIDGKLYPVINGNGGTAVVLLNGQEYPVTNGNGGTAVVLLNGQEYPVVNGNGGTAIVLLNGQIYPVLFNAAGNPYIQYNGTQYPVTNGNGGTAVVLLNGQELPVLNGNGGTAVVLLNGEYYAVFNGNGGTAVILLNGTEYPVVNGNGGTAVVLLNGQEIPVLNGSGGTAVVLLNGVEYPVVNGSGGTAVILLNGQEIPVVNGNGGTAVVLLNGNEYPVVNGNGGTAVVLLNGQMHPVLNGNGGTAVVLLNGQQIPLINGNGGTAVVLLNGEIHPVFNGNGGTAVILLNGQEIPVVNGNGGTAVVLLNGQEIPVVNSISPEVLTNMSTLASTLAIANARIVNTSNSVTNLVDVSANSFNSYNINPAQTSLLNTLPLVNSRGLLDVDPIANASGGTAVVLLNNGTTVPVVNGSTAYVNSETVAANSISRTPVIIDEADVNSTSTATIQMEGINMITGITSGEQYLLPATLLNPNLIISYKPGKVNITKAALNIRANDTSKIYGNALQLIPTKFTITGGAMKYDERILLVNLTSNGTPDTADVGNYPIIPSNAFGAYGTDPSNYHINYLNGTLTVNKQVITVTADPKYKIYGNTDPQLTYTVTTGTLINGDQVTGNLARDAGENVGVYQIRQGSLTGGTNYQLAFQGANLTINKAPLTVTADNKSKVVGDPNPSFTATITGFKFGQTLANSGVSGTAAFSTTANESSPPGTYPITPSAGTLSAANYYFNSFVPGILTVTDNNSCLLTHSKFSSFGSTSSSPTSLWLNIEIKVSGQLSVPGDYIMFSGGSISFNNISSSPAVNNLPVKRGIIIADGEVTEPVTYFNNATDMFVTKVPVGFSSTSDIFISGVIINSSNGFNKKNNPNSILKGIFYTNKQFSDQWNYAMAAYQKPGGGYVQYADLYDEGSIVSINGNYKAGTPLPWLDYIASGGSGNGGNNYTGTQSSNDNFTACLLGNTVTSRQYESTEQLTENTPGINSFIIYPNPASNYVNIAFSSISSGNTEISIYSAQGSKVANVYAGYTEAGKTYNSKMSTRSFSKGIYFIRYQQNGNMTIKKLIISGG